MAWGDDAPPGYDDVEIDVVRQAAPPMKHTSGSRYMHYNTLVAVRNSI